MLHTCATKFDVMENFKRFWFLDATKQGLKYIFNVLYMCLNIPHDGVKDF